jgi:hypothetical protein
MEDVMKIHVFVKMLWILTLIVFSVPDVGCKGQEKEKTFKPGEMESYDNPKLGFSIMKPKNVKTEEKGDLVSFVAEGFPVVTVSFQKTDSKSGTSCGGGSHGSSGYKWTVESPLRKLTCICEDTGSFEDVVKEMCKSLKNTIEAPKNPNIVFNPPKLEGKLKDPTAFEKALDDLKGPFTDCWKQALEKDKKLSSGFVGFTVVLNADGTKKSGSVSSSFSGGGDSKLVTDCISPLFDKVKIEPDNAEVKLVWDLDFESY